MKIIKITIGQNAYPERLRHLNDPPQQLYYSGANLPELLGKPCVAIVGSRAASPYGRQVTEGLAADCARAGVVIISGLAFGIDSFAHQAALDCGGTTIAVLPSGLGHIYPSSHQRLAEQIIQNGGALISEYSANTPPQKYQFIARNRLIAGLSQIVVVTEAAKNSGSLHTAQFALQQNSDVMVVPGNITSPTSQGSNNLIMHSSALPITSSAHILKKLNLQPAKARASPKGDTPAEQTILDLLHGGVYNGTALLGNSQLSVPVYSFSLSMLEIKGQIKPLGGDNWQLCT